MYMVVSYSTLANGTCLCVSYCFSPAGSGGNTSPGGSRKGGREGDGEGAGPSGTKPHLRVKIPGQKGFVPRTVSI